MISTAAGEYVVVEAQLPDHAAEPIGILLLDPEADKAHVRLRRDLDSLAADDLDGEALAALEDDLKAKSDEVGAAAFLRWLEDNASNVIRIGEREHVMVDSFDAALDRLYRK